jgi:hypothetical protein
LIRPIPLAQHAALFKITTHAASRAS